MINMRRFLLLYAIFIGSNVYSQSTLIPDPNFEQVLIDLGYDNTLDGSVLTANISSVTMLNIPSSGIADLTGIADFSSLTNLYCWSNGLTSLDVSQNVNLTYLDCGLNQITSLDVSQNINLIDLHCHYNDLTSIDVSQNTLLESLEIHGNLLTLLDVSQNTALTYLSCGVSTLTDLDLSQNTLLAILDCGSSQLTSLDVSQNTSLSTLYCNDNNLNCLNLKNGNNNNIINFWSQNNPSLTCIEVDNVTYSTNNWTSIPPGASFSVNCSNACSVGIQEIENSTLKEIVKIVDLLGRESQFETNKLLIVHYSDGSSEKIFVVN